MSENEKERMLDLLTDRVLFGLTLEEDTELKALEEKYPELKEDNSFELTASAINLAHIETIEPMPEHLRAKILTDSEKLFSKSDTPANVLNFQPKSSEIIQPATIASHAATNITNSSKNSGWQWLGWGLAAAACIALAVNLWIGGSSVNPTPPVLTASQQREQMLKDTPDVMRAEWSEADPKQKQGITGDIVWSNSKQQGFMRLRGFPKNDAAKETYQLWIFDANQDEKTPIDGGVFDINETGEVIVPIDAKIKVEKPQMFAVTMEKPGGVVVSKREKILTIAKVSV